MKEDEVVLSDLHIYTENVEADSSHLFNALQVKNINHTMKVVKSRFVFQLPPSLSLHVSKLNEVEEKPNNLLFDDDGDLLVKRKKEHSSMEIIILEHSLATPLSLVGLQVWQGALFLADYLLHNGHSTIKDRYVLELGAGSGLCSIVAAIFAEFVICTDKGDTILELCSRNVKNSCDLYNYIRCGSNFAGSRPKIKELDWTKENPFVFSSENRWNWTLEDVEEFKRVTVLLAADVIYDDQLTDAFFKTIQLLMLQGKPKTLYLTLEKRLPCDPPGGSTISVFNMVTMQQKVCHVLEYEKFSSIVTVQFVIFFLWGHVKDTVYLPPTLDVGELQDCITSAVMIIDRDMLQHVCAELGYHINM